AFGLWHRDLDLGAIDRLIEAEADLGFEVAPAYLLGLSTSATTAAAEEVGEDVADVEAACSGAPRPERTPPASAEAPEHPASRVLFLALLGIGERVVCPLDFLEPLLRLRIVRVAVRVVLARQLAVRLLDLLLGSPLRDPEHLVEIFSHQLLAHHHT